MSISADSTVLNAQVIRVLCRGIQQETLILSSLQSRFPLQNWTLEQLQQVLALGLKQGRYLRVSVNPIRWQLRLNMGDVFPQNIKYQSLCNTIRASVSQDGIGLSCGP